jgi:NAD(P)-dependent dehydrogenase (short-subunit alcohol dehydrogenase family)
MTISYARAEDFQPPSFRLDGRVALVTGAGRGLGQAVALALAHAGADVAAAARSAVEVEETCARAAALGRQTLARPVDLLEPGNAAALVQDTVSNFGRLDILVHAAGVNIRQPAGDFTPADVSRIMRVNVESAFFLAQAAAPVMRGAGRGRIICITSVATRVAIPRVSVYSMSKAALEQMVRALAIEWARDGITVNAIAPGRFWTSMTDAVFSNPALHESAVRVIPMGRPGVPADLGGAAVFLASDASAYMTGQTIVVDGGWLASAGVAG